MELPKWKCHKIVQAAKIIRINGDRMIVEDAKGQAVAMSVDGGTLFARYKPVVGDYYVIYEDGYASISPKKAFEDGYTRI